MGGEAEKFPTGQDRLTNNDANLGATGEKDIWEFTAPVGSFGRNALGISDMAGNVWEWCYDVHQGYGNDTSSGVGKHVIRGGSYKLFDWHCRASSRLPFDSSGGAPDVGFRVVLIIPGDSAGK